MTQDIIGYADLHMHTSASDGQLAVRELLDFVCQHRPQLDVIAITDHDRLDSSLRACELQHRYPFEVVPGVEVSSRAGHILALWVTTPIPTWLNLTETVSAIHEAGGLAILAHPFHLELRESRRNAFRFWQDPTVLVESGLDAIEVHNAGVVVPGSNLAARIIARQIGLAVTGSSDAHTPGAIGRGVTRFPGKRATALRLALQQRQTVAQGTAWHLTDYIAYLKHERQRRATQSLARLPS